MSEALNGKVVIVTGASSGVGEAAARAFGRAGAKVILAARSRAKIESVAQAVGGLAVPTDVSRLDDLQALVDRAMKAFGRIDVLVNNAAANARGDLDTLDPQGIATVIDTNLKAPLMLTRLALPHLRASRGVVVNVASIAGHVPLPHESPY
jgi:NADP-dependent 3-hydroxy acid dehydrogenase YdfG